MLRNQNPYTRRWVIVATIVVAIVCNYLDRQLLSILKPEILGHFNIGDIEFAWILNVFLICYAIMYPVSGILVDKFGPKPVMFGGIAAWSLACVGGGLSQDVYQFAACRGILGLAEPTIFTGQIVAVTLWFEKKTRATANALCQAGGSIGTMTAPLAVAWMVRYFPWQDVFIIAGVVGLAIAGLWWMVYSKPQPEFLAMTLDEPTAKVKKQRYFKLGALFGTSALWGVILIRLVSDPVWYFINFWLPGYLRNLGVEQGMTTQQTLDMIQYIGGIPFLVGATLGVLASAYSDRLVSRGWNSLRSRKVVMSLSACVAPIIALVPILSHWEGVAFSVRLGLITAVFAIVAFVCLVWLYNIGVVVAESFPVKNVASVIGIACGAGAVGAACFNLIVGSLMSTMGEYLFYCMGALHPIAAFVLIKLVKPAVPDSKNSIEDSDSSIDNDVCGLDAVAN